MKAGAGALLVLAAVVYVTAWRAEHSGAGGWAGYLRAAAEAGLIGGLADWFAVTALFRRPLGLPIPHTAIIPTRKDALGRNLGDFVGANFLSPDVVRDRLRRAGVTARVAAWLATPQHAERVIAELAVAASSAIGVLRDEDVQELLEREIGIRLRTVSVAPPLGRLLGRVVDERAHVRLVDVAVERAHRWLLDERKTVIGLVLGQAPDWSPGFLDGRIAARVHAELVRVAGDVAVDKYHPWRLALDRMLDQLAVELQQDAAMRAKVDDLTGRLLQHPEVRRAVGDLVAAARELALELINDPDSALRTGATEALVSLGRRVAEDPALSAKVDGWIEDAAVHVVTNYRDELTRTITDTVDRWDGAEAARKVELAVGRDLQFIRINGTVVGAIAGLTIHAITNLAL